MHTGHIAPEVTRLNGSLAAIRDGLQAIDGSLGRTSTSVQGQGARMNTEPVIPDFVYTLWGVTIVVAISCCDR